MGIKTDIIRLAKKKGFASDMLCMVPFEYSTKEPLRWYFLLCEIQRWLINDKHIDISVEGVGSGKYYCIIFDNNREDDKIFEQDGHTSYENSLLIGVQEALKLIKDI